MGNPRPNYGRVKGMYDHQGLAGGRRWGPSLGGQINHNSYTNTMYTSVCVITLCPNLYPNRMYTVIGVIEHCSKPNPKSQS